MLHSKSVADLPEISLKTLVIKEYTKPALHTREASSESSDFDSFKQKRVMKSAMIRSNVSLPQVTDFSQFSAQPEQKPAGLRMREFSLSSISECNEPIPIQEPPRQQLVNY